MSGGFIKRGGLPISVTGRGAMSGSRGRIRISLVKHDRFPSPAPAAATSSIEQLGQPSFAHRFDPPTPTMPSRVLQPEAPCHVHADPALWAAGRPMQRDCGSLPFLIQRDGTWLYQGTPIRRKPMVCLFASVIRRDEAGRYRLETPVERGEIEVEDVPFVAVELDWSGCGRDQVLSFRTNVDEIVCAGPDHPLEVDWECARSGGECAAIPYLTVRPGDGALPIQARVARAVFYELAALAVEGVRHGMPCLGVWSQNRFFPIGPLETAFCHSE